MKTEKGKSAARAAPRQGRAGRILAVVAVVLLLAVTGLVIAYAVITDGFTQFVYVEYGGRRMETRETGVQLDRGENVFEVKSLKPASGGPEYTVAVYPNAEADFYYRVGDNPHSFPMTGELTEYFDVRIDGSQFTVNVPLDYTLAAVLGQKYPGEEITLPDELPQTDLLAILVSFSDGKSTAIYFGVLDKPVIELDPPNIVF